MLAAGRVVRTPQPAPGTCVPRQASRTEDGREHQRRMERCRWSQSRPWVSIPFHRRRKKFRWNGAMKTAVLSAQGLGGCLSKFAPLAHPGLQPASGSPISRFQAATAPRGRQRGSGEGQSIARPFQQSSQLLANRLAGRAQQRVSAPFGRPQPRAARFVGPSQSSSIVEHTHHSHLSFYCSVASRQPRGLAGSSGLLNAPFSNPLNASRFFVLLASFLLRSFMLLARLLPAPFLDVFFSPSC